MGKYNLVSCTSGVPMLLGLIPQGTPTATSSGRSIQITSYVEGTCCFWLVLFVNPLWRYHLCKGNANFLGHFVSMILANRVQFNVWGNIIGTNRAGKCSLTLHSGISITDKVKINEQNKSIATGPLYVHTKFEVIWTLLPEDVVVCYLYKSTRSKSCRTFRFEVSLYCTRETQVK